MTVQQFHQDLLGRVATEAQQAIYRRGYRWVPTQDPESQVAGIILALWLVKQGGPTYLLVPQGKDQEILGQVTAVFRHCIRLRKGNPPAIQAIKKAFEQLSCGTKLFSIVEPDRWVGVGFEETRVPDWFTRKI
jgi:hypothetical protein